MFGVKHCSVFTKVYLKLLLVREILLFLGKNCSADSGPMIFSPFHRGLYDATHKELCHCTLPPLGLNTAQKSSSISSMSLNLRRRAIQSLIPEYVSENCLLILCASHSARMWIAVSLVSLQNRHTSVSTNPSLQICRLNLPPILRNGHAVVVSTAVVVPQKQHSLPEPKKSHPIFRYLSFFASFQSAESLRYYETSLFPFLSNPRPPFCRPRLIPEPSLRACTSCIDRAHNRMEKMSRIFRGTYECSVRTHLTPLSLSIYLTCCLIL